jgi:C-terminal processing protease CtpA/Prc
LQFAFCNLQFASTRFLAPLPKQTRGVVLLGNHFTLPNQFDLHLSVGDHHTAKGIRLERRGVIPDIAVDEITVKDFRENRAPVLDRILQLLQER